MRILMLLSNPFTHDSRVYEETISLVKEGYSITMLAWDRKGVNPPEEMKDGIRIVRFHKSRFMNLMRYDIFKLRSWWRNATKLALKLHMERPFDVVHCHDMDTLPAGIILKKKLDLPIIYDAHEIFGYMLARDLPKLWSDYYFKKEKKIIDYVDRIITVNQPLKDYFNKISDRPVTIVMNCKPLQEGGYEAPQNEKLNLIYIGTLGESRFIHELMDVMAELPGIHCTIGGWGKEDYVDDLKNMILKLDNVTFLGLVPPKKVLPLTKKSDIVICMTNPEDGNNSRATANKQFEAMVCGRPIICTEGTYPGKFTLHENVGITAAYNRKSLKMAIKKLASDPKLREKLGRNALEAAKREYNWHKMSQRLVEVYENLR